MTINGVQGDIGNMSRGGGGGEVRMHNRGLSGRGGGGGGGRGNNIEACPGGWSKTEACPGGIYKSVPGRWRYNISLSKGAYVYCLGGGGGYCLQLLSFLGM